MAGSLFWLSDETWKTLEAHLPRGKPGKPRVDDRTVISGIHRSEIHPLPPSIEQVVSQK